MAQKSDESSESQSAGSRSSSSGGGSSARKTESAAPASASASTRKGVRMLGSERKQFLIASRRAPGLSIMGFGVGALALHTVEEALRDSPDIEVVDTLGPRHVVGALADGMIGAPNVIVARMDESKAEALRQQGQGQLIVERDQPLTLLDVPFEPPVIPASVAGLPPLSVQVTVVNKDEEPLEGAEVYLFGTLLPAVGVTSSSGQATLSVLGDTAQSIRALYVKPRSDYWSFYQTQPDLDTSQPNIVMLKPLSDTYPDFPRRQFMGWGQKAMRLDQLPSELRGQGVRVAIIDSGAATSHEDLKSINKGFDVLGKHSNSNNWMTDNLSHGSHCAGIIAGSEENGMGIRGFAPAAEIHVCKIFPGGQVSQLIDALEYCIERQIDVVNLSLGMEQISELLEQQLARVANLGIACIAAAGNSGGSVQYPASSPHVLAVAALGRVGEFPPESYHARTVVSAAPDGYFSPRFTCFGPEIAVCAPGVAIVSSVPQNNFVAWDGTSMAAPHVAGLAALVLAHHPDFSGTFRARTPHRVQRLFQILKASARPVNLGDRRRTGFGLPDAPTALGLQIGMQQAPSAQTTLGLRSLMGSPLEQIYTQPMQTGIPFPGYLPGVDQTGWAWWGLSR